MGHLVDNVLSSSCGVVKAVSKGLPVQSALQNRQLLAVDVGLRSGVAMFGSDGRLRWYRSQACTTVPQLRRVAGRLLGAPGDVSWLISEGDVSLAAVWERIAMRQGVRVQRVDKLTWRGRLLEAPCALGLVPSAAEQAQHMARQVIQWSGGPAPAVLQPDAAAAILIGLWGVIQLGWLDAAAWQQGSEAPLERQQLAESH
jgi:hypothetical protein